MLTGAGNEEVAVRALKAGVSDYLNKANLDKEVLRTAILNAFEDHKAENQRRLETTQQGDAFNKALFYQQLEYKKGDPEYRERVLLFIQLDNYTVIEDLAGPIMLDNIIRHIAKHSFEVFKNGECDPNITKLSNNQIALLIDSPVSTKTLEFNIGGLIKHLSKRPYKYEEKKFRFTVSIGVVHLPEEGSNVDTIMQYARSACEIATQSEGNSYHVNSDADQIPTIVQTPTSEPVADIVEPKDDTDTSNEHEITELHLQ